MSATISPSETAKLTRVRTRRPPKLRATSVPSRKGPFIDWTLSALRLQQQRAAHDQADRQQADPSERLLEQQEAGEQDEQGGGTPMKNDEVTFRPRS